MSNYQILVFYSEQRHIIIYGNATNWNSSGYFEVFDEERKYSTNVWQTTSLYHLVNETINYNNSFYRNARFSGDNETYWEFHWFMKIRLIYFPNSHTSLHIIFVLWYVELTADIVEDTEWSTSDLELVFVKGRGLCIAWRR